MYLSEQAYIMEEIELKGKQFVVLKSICLMRTRGAVFKIGSHFTDIRPPICTHWHVKETSKGPFGFSWTSTVIVY